MIQNFLKECKHKHSDVTHVQEADMSPIHSHRHPQFGLHVAYDPQRMSLEEPGSHDCIVSESNTLHQDLQLGRFYKSLSQPLEV